MRQKPYHLRLTINMSLPFKVMENLLSTLSNLLRFLTFLELPSLYNIKTLTCVREQLIKYTSISQIKLVLVENN